MLRWLRSPAVVLLAVAADLLFFGGPRWPHHALRPSMSAAMAAQELVTARWLDLDEVVGTSIGMEGPGAWVVNLYVTGMPSAGLPATMNGIPVRTQVTGPFIALGDPPTWAMADDEPVDPKKSFPRPVPIGVSTGHQNVTAGTIGARVTDGDRVFALSNNHVYAANNGGRAGDPLLQPGVADGGRAPDDVLGTLHDFVPIAFCRSFTCPDNHMDAALALTTGDDLGQATPEDGYGAPRSSTAEAAIGLAVQKYGRTTGHTKGRVTGLNATLDISYRTGSARFTGQIVVSGRGFSAGGDSGSLIVTDGVLWADRRPVGLLFAGSATNTIASPIEPILDHFGVSVDGESR